MGRTQGQTRTRSTKLLLFAVLLLTVSCVSAATPPLAQVAGEGGPSVTATSEKENLAGNPTEVSGANGTPPKGPQNVSPAGTPGVALAKDSPSPPAPEKEPLSPAKPVDSVGSSSGTSESTSLQLPGQPSDKDSDAEDEAETETCGVYAHLDDASGECVCDYGHMTFNSTVEVEEEGCPCADNCGMWTRCPSNTHCSTIGCKSDHNLLYYKCECDEGFYDAVSKNCTGVCDYFGNAVCGLDETRECKQGSSKEDYTCECVDGYEPGPDDTCIEKDHCASSPCHKRNEECENKPPGNYTCKCKDGYVRNENGDCEEWDQCLNPKWNNCEQLCENEDGGKNYTCSCYEGFELEDDQCILVDEDRACECEGMTEGTYFCWTNDEGEDICYPRAGFEITETNKTKDINECIAQKGLCGPNSNCLNDFGGASCSCLSGFYSAQDNGAFCVALECPQGEVPYGDKCIDPCSSSPCTGTTTCRAGTDGTPECHCGSECLNQNHQNSSLSVYSGTLTIRRLPGALDLSSYSRSILVKSLETIFGRGTIDVIPAEETRRQGRQAEVPAFPSSGDKEEEEDEPTPVKARFDFTVWGKYSEVDFVAEIIESYCQVAGDDEDLCLLPGGVVVLRSKIVMINNTDPCKNDSCPFPHARCTTMEDQYGRYKCECEKGFESAGELPGIWCQDVDECRSGDAACNGTCVNTPGSFYCVEDCKGEEINNDDLNKRLDDSEHALTVVSAVLGTLFCLALIAVGVLAVLITNQGDK